MRWCGRYAEVQPGAFLVAFDHEKRVLGYLAGCIDSFGESARAIASEIDYFTADFCAGMQAYPSHFHINVSPVHQGRGVGHSLTMHFIDLCRRSGSPGIHIVTGAASRAVRFYEACNFRCLAPGVAASAAHAVMVYPLT